MKKNKVIEIAAQKLVVGGYYSPKNRPGSQINHLWKVRPQVPQADSEHVRICILNLDTGNVDDQIVPISDFPRRQLSDREVARRKQALLKAMVKRLHSRVEKF